MSISTLLPQLAYHNAHRVAIVQGDIKMTYQQLVQHVNALSMALHQQQDGAVTLVLLEEGTVLVTAVLMIMHTGQVFISLSLTLPQQPFNALFAQFSDAQPMTITHHQITVIHQIPLLLQTLLDYPETVDRLHTMRYIFLVGEMLKGSLVRHFYQNDLINAQLINLYDVIETRLAKLFHQVIPEDTRCVRIPVGHALPDKEIRLVDKTGDSVAENESEEVIIAMPWMSASYKDHVMEFFLTNAFDWVAVIAKRAWCYNSARTLLLLIRAADRLYTFLCPRAKLCPSFLSEFLFMARRLSLTRFRPFSHSAGSLDPVINVNIPQDAFRQKTTADMEDFPQLSIWLQLEADGEQQNADSGENDSITINLTRTTEDQPVLCITCCYFNLNGITQFINLLQQELNGATFKSF